MDKKKFTDADYEYCHKVMFPFMIRLRRHVDTIKSRLAAGEKLKDIHADMAAKGERL